MKKIIAAGLLTLGMLITKAQNKQAQIDAKVPGFFNGSWAFLRNSRGNTLDSAKVENGHFKLLTGLDEPIFVNLHLKKDSAVFSDQFYIQPGKVALRARFNNEHKITRSNISRTGATELQDQWAAYNSVISPVQDSLRKTQSKYMSVFGQRDTASRWKLKKQTDQLNKEKKELQVSFIQKNPASYMSYVALKDMIGVVPTTREVALVQDLYHTLSAEIKSYPSAMEFQENLSRFAALAIGKHAPNFTSTSPEGKKLSLDQFRGKYILLDFWASWCIPCRAENPVLVKAYLKFHDKNFDILSVSLDQNGEKGKAAWLKAIKDDGMPWNHVSDLEFWNSPVAKLYAIKAVPQNFLIAPDGKIIASNLRGLALEKELEKILLY